MFNLCTGPTKTFMSVVEAFFFYILDKLISHVHVETILSRFLIFVLTKILQMNVTQ